MNPTLIQNEMTDADLGQRNYIIDGVNGYDLTQLNAQVDESMTLQVNGVPVLVHPESMLMTNEMAATKLFTDGTIDIGPDEITATQIEGVPVLVNPESMLMSNTMAAARIFANGTVDIGPDEITAAQMPEDIDESVTLQVNGVPVLVNPESMLMSNTMAGSRIFANGTLDIGPDEITAVYVHGVPVLVNPESMLLKNEMASSKIFPKGTLDIGADEISAFAQRQ